jgi:hypothetical protein
MTGFLTIKIRLTQDDEMVDTLFQTEDNYFFILLKECVFMLKCVGGISS